MNKRILDNRFGLIALIVLSLAASTAAFAATGPQQVVVTNTSANPVPVACRKHSSTRQLRRLTAPIQAT
jgi:hypothetical protein